MLCAPTTVQSTKSIYHLQLQHNEILCVPTTVQSPMSKYHLQLQIEQVFSNLFKLNHINRIF